MNLSQAQLDFGLMNRAVPLLAATEQLLGERRISLTLNCPQPTDMSLFIAAWARTPSVFGLPSAAAMACASAKRCLTANPWSSD